MTGGKRRLYCDLDGVLVDFEGAALEACGIPFAAFADVHGTSAVWKRLERTEGFYANAKWLDDGRKLWRLLSEVEPPVRILSGLPLGDWADPQKREWCLLELGPTVPVITCLSKDKYHHCVPGDILIDDRLDTRTAWEGAGGIFVHHVTLEKTIERLHELHVFDPPVVVPHGHFKSSDTGEFVDNEFAAAHPVETYELGTKRKKKR